MDRRNQTNTLATPRTASIEPALASTLRRPSQVRTPGDGGGVGGASRADLAAWLVAGRVARGMTREHVARVTRIQLRTIERLEEARFDELPADVFVRGFIRNYAMCVGLSVDDALARYAACGFAAAPVASAQAQALIETMASLAPVAATRTSSVVVVPAPEPAPAPAVPAVPMPVEAAPATGKRARDSRGRFIKKQAALTFEDLEVEITIIEEPVAPPAPRVIEVKAAPTLTIDDDDPESAEREREDREDRLGRAREKDGGWRSFLPPALLDQDRGRQGGLTLAVIILLIVATLTLSYLMRRPSSTGEGVTLPGIRSERATLVG